MLYGPLNCFRIKSYLLPNNYCAIIILFPLQRRDEEPKAVNMLVTVHTVEIESESWLETTHHRTLPPTYLKFVYRVDCKTVVFGGKRRKRDPRV